MCLRYIYTYMYIHETHGYLVTLLSRYMRDIYVYEICVYIYIYIDETHGYVVTLLSKRMRDTYLYEIYIYIFMR